ncbi:FAD binding domain-containing protein [Apiosordaria backusii]|uniref:FAD binding domain-containing protein n=1 Tax=Apiosordaria backusii TaxID=314023 RepID=A0AA40BLM0_9PEZI|nr:FAD binding domain-containing protein [Apiosordaria backusii]
MTPEEKVPVLIAGSGSAGLCAAAWLARFNIPYKILERRNGPLEIGQADGVQTRTVEIFDSFGIAEEMLREAYHVLEIAFWSPEGEKGIKRVRYEADKETEISHQPHVILNQARLNALMTGLLGSNPPIEYGCEVKNVVVDENVDSNNLESYPVRVDAVQDGVQKTYRAKYVLGCDGAHSIIRKSLGFKMVGDSSDAVWGVMDIYPRTNFPDIRKKAVISSAVGNILLIPREGNSMVRFYTELPAGTKASDVSLEKLHDHARKVFQPYEMEFAETFWWSAYSIGQRRADFFHRDHRVFLTGDACHTHSPKAGQGMNVSLQDGHNIGWKLGMVLQGLARPDILETYVLERERTATELIDFDRNFTKLFNTKYRQEHGVTAEMFAEQFTKAGRYTAGQAVQYDASAITHIAEHDKELVPKVTVGMRFPTAQVVRSCDAKAMQLIKGLPANGQWYVVVFSGDLSQPEAMSRLEQQVSQTLSQITQHFTPTGVDPDGVIDRILVTSGDRKKVELDEIPEYFKPVTGKWKMKNLFKIFADDESYNSGHGHAYAAYGVDASKGAIVVVRPDHYVAKVCKLEDAESLGVFFEGFLVPAQSGRREARHGV